MDTQSLGLSGYSGEGHLRAPTSGPAAAPPRSPTSSPTPPIRDPRRRPATRRSTSRAPASRTPPAPTASRSPSTSAESPTRTRWRPRSTPRFSPPATVPPSRPRRSRMPASRLRSTPTRRRAHPACSSPLPAPRSRWKRATQTANALLGNIVREPGRPARRWRLQQSPRTTRGDRIATAVATETVNLGVHVGGTTTNVPLPPSRRRHTRHHFSRSLNAALTAANAGVTAALDGGNKLQFTADQRQSGAERSGHLPPATPPTSLVWARSRAPARPRPTAASRRAPQSSPGETQHIQIAVGNQVADLGAAQRRRERSDRAQRPEQRVAGQRHHARGGHHRGRQRRQDQAGLQQQHELPRERVRAPGTNVGFGFADRQLPWIRPRSER